jgi:ATP-binding cassette subfamily C protein CydC
MKALLAFSPLFSARLGRMGLALLLALVALLAGIALLGVSGWFLTAAFLTTAGMAFNLFGPSALVRGFSFIRILARYGEKLTGHDATLRLLSDIRGWLFASLFPRLPLRQAMRHGDLVSRLTADVDALDTAFLVALGPLATALLGGLAVALALGLLMPAALMVYLPGYFIAALVVPVLLVLLTRERGRQLVEATAEARIALLDSLDGKRDLIAFDAAATARQRYATTTNSLASLRREIGRRQAIAAGAIQGLAGITLIGLLAIAISAFEAGTVTAPVLVGLLLAALGSFEATALIVRSVARLGAAIAAAERLDALARSPAAVSDSANPQQLPTDHTLVLAGVRFGYAPARPVLRDLDISLPPGSRTAIVGLSGAGKSTLLHLLLRLVDPDAGTITLGGVPLSQLRLADLHRTIALLGKDAPIFADSVRDNLLIGNPGASDTQLWAALEAARLDGHIRALPQGLDTLLGEDAGTLSTGQARRLALARVLLTPASILVFDEPTAGLDPETEAELLADLRSATAGRTVILATHARLPAGAVDTTLTLSAGRLVAFDPRGL